LAQLVDLSDTRASGNLHDALVERHLPVKGRGRVRSAIIAHHRRLDHHPDVHLDHEGDDAGIRKVDLLNRTASFGNHIAKLQLNGFQMRRKGR
jgi:hypothetical protein